MMLPHSHIERPWLPTIIFLCGGLHIGVCGCGGKSPSESPAKPLVIVASGDTAGWIEPCGCTSNQSGGLPRRGTYVANLRQRHEVLLLDVGGAAADSSAYGQAKLSAILAGERAMGLFAHNIGGSEARQGPEYLRQCALQSSLVSCNVRDRQGQLLAAPYRVFRGESRQAVAVFGVLSQRYAADGLDVSPPREALLAALKQAAQESGPTNNSFAAIVVLAYLPPDELRVLARELPEVDLVLGGPSGQSIASEQIGHVLLASATNKGKFLAKLEPLPSKDRGTSWSGSIVEMTDQFEDQPEQRKNIAAFQRLLADRDFRARDTAFLDGRSQQWPAGYGIAGSDACQDCHQQDHHAWQATAHASAWATLKSSGSQVDSYCQQCHVTGYGLPGGFVSNLRSPQRVSVGCENCHGPSAAHAAQPRTQTPFFGRARDACIQCHDEENSPKFQYEAAWPKIQHGAHRAVDAPGVKP